MRTAGAPSASAIRLLDALAALTDQIDSELDALRDAYARSQSIEQPRAQDVYKRQAPWTNRAHSTARSQV